MDNAFHFIGTFVANISLLFMFMYVANLLYKHLLYTMPAAALEWLFVLLAVTAGWLTMHNGLRLTETIMFDLRYMTIIVAPMFLQRKPLILLLGLSVGAVRLSFGLNEASWVGFMNMAVMSLIVIAAVTFSERYEWKFYKKMSAVIWSVNIANVVFLASFGVIPTGVYLYEIAPVTFLLSIVLGYFFLFVLRDFMLEAGRRSKLLSQNKKLAKQYRISEETSRQLFETGKALQDNNQQLMQASQYKTEFLASMSHELRTPLNAVLVLAQLLEENEEGNLTEEQVQYAKLIGLSGDTLLSMLNEILDMSKIEAGKMELYSSEIALGEMLDIIEQTFKPLADSKKILFEVERELGLPEVITTDGQRLNQILRNLLSNAFKFTNQGAVHLDTFVKQAAEDSSDGAAAGRWLGFSITDTGIGIPESKQHMIFDAFSQADNTISQLFGGTGLGLSISKKLAEMLGGRIELESKEGAGSTFTLYVPI
ncbi:sensor histidine kinase [Paenibacillus sp. GCM10023252]|uniref:sensor histidine kinase n=1 Tax=Paenibacillus sp. GCM10023252 TaxID=3252649 RepID=UPI00360C44AA